MEPEHAPEIGWIQPIRSRQQRSSGPRSPRPASQQCREGMERLRRVATHVRGAGAAGDADVESEVESGTATAVPERRISHVKLREAIVRVLAASGANEEVQTIVADHLIDANLRGHDSHGIQVGADTLLPRRATGPALSAPHPTPLRT